MSLTVKLNNVFKIQSFPNVMTYFPGQMGYNIWTLLHLIRAYHIILYLRDLKNRKRTWQESTVGPL